MSLKDKKASASERLKNERLQCEEKFETDIAQANEIADPTERVLQLREIGRTMSNDNWQEKSKIQQTTDKVYPADGKEFLTYMALGIAIPIAGGVTYIVKRNKHRDSFKEQLNKEAEDHFNNMSDKQTRLAEIIDTLVEEHVQEIAQSPKREDVLNDPDLVKKFATAAIKKGISLAEEPVPQQAKRRLLLKNEPGAK